jgi:acyl carrier protein
MTQFLSDIPDTLSAIPTKERSMAVKAPPKKWTATELEVILFDLLGKLLNEDPTELREKLEAKDANMPVDSLDIFDILAEFRILTGLTLPKRELRQETVRSVAALAKFAAEKTKAGKGKTKNERQ